MKTLFVLFLFATQVSSAKEIYTNFIISNKIENATNAIRESYTKEGVDAALIKQTELTLYGLDSVNVKSTGKNSDLVEISITFASSYVRDLADGVNDLCTVKLQSTASFEQAGEWKVTKASCESYD